MKQEEINGILHALRGIEEQLVGIKKRLGNIQHGPAVRAIRAPENAEHLEDFKSLVEEHRALIESQHKAIRHSGTSGADTLGSHGI